MDIQYFVADHTHVHFAAAICQLIEFSAKVRGTGIALREVSYIEKKINNGNAVIALNGDELVGFCYVEIWDHDKYVANSGLVVHPDYRQMGLARTIKQHAFQLARRKYPDAKVFGITTSSAVMKINYDLGYRPVAFAELTQDETFWKGCQSCPNYDILERNQRRMCLCTGMLADAKNTELEKQSTPPKELVNAKSK